MLTLPNAIIVKMHVKTNLLFPPLLHRSLETDVYDPQHKTPSIRVIRHSNPQPMLPAIEKKDDILEIVA